MLANKELLREVLSAGFLEPKKQRKDFVELSWALQLGCPVTCPSVGKKLTGFGHLAVCLFSLGRDDQEGCALAQHSPNQITVAADTDKGVLDTLCGSLIPAKVEIVY